MRAVLLLLACACLLTACGDDAPTPDVKTLLADGNAAFARGDELASGETPAEGRDVEAWAEAAQAYADAFRLMDPDPARARERGMVAFRIARAYAKAARAGERPSYARYRANQALTWLDQVERLIPGMRQVHYERALLFDSQVERVRDLVAAHGAYDRYLNDVDFQSSVPDSEKARVAHARERRAALAPPVDAPADAPDDDE